jgi:hypothetical protein
MARWLQERHCRRLSCRSAGRRTVKDLRFVLARLGSVAVPPTSMPWSRRPPVLVEAKWEVLLASKRKMRYEQHKNSRNLPRMLYGGGAQRMLIIDRRCCGRNRKLTMYYGCSAAVAHIILPGWAGLFASECLPVAARSDSDLGYGPKIARVTLTHRLSHCASGCTNNGLRSRCPRHPCGGVRCGGEGQALGLAPFELVHREWSRKVSSRPETTCAT